MTTLQFQYGGALWKHKMLSVMTSRQPGITGFASLSVRRFFAAAALPRQNPFFAKACAVLREIHAFSLAFGSVSKLRENLQTPVGFSVSLQPRGAVKIQLLHFAWKTFKKRRNLSVKVRASMVLSEPVKKSALDSTRKAQTSHSEPAAGEESAFASLA
jgi:hypothetical protein